MAPSRPRRRGFRRRAVRAAFLAAFAKTGVITTACAMSGADRRDVYRWLDDPELTDFHAGFRDAEKQAADYLEQEAVRRAVVGWEEPVFGRTTVVQNGKAISVTGQVGSVRKYSDRLLEMMLKARNPKFRERTAVEIGGDPENLAPVRTEAVHIYLPSNGRDPDDESGEG